MMRLASACVRLCVYLFMLLTGVSLALASICPTPASPPPTWQRRRDALTVPYMPGQRDDIPRQILISFGQSSPTPLTLPGGTQWGTMSISPWVGPGDAEAVVTCNRPPSSSAAPFCGLVRISLPEGRILEEDPLDMLPTGRPCWMPQTPGRVLFSAGDGRLYYRDFLTAEDDLGGPSARDGIRPVTWEKMSDDAPVYLADAFVPEHERLRDLVIATEIGGGPRGPRPTADSTRFWWCRLDPQRMTIRATGLLADPSSHDPSHRPAVARFPLLVAAPNGAARLVYVARRQGDPNSRLESLPVTLDPVTGCPDVPEAAQPIVIGEDTGMAPLVVSSDGREVYCVSRSSGLPVRYMLAERDRPLAQLPIASRTEKEPRRPG